MSDTTNETGEKRHETTIHNSFCVDLSRSQTTDTRITRGVGFFTHTRKTKSGMTTALTKPESKELAECESVINKGLNSFFEVGEALFTIRDKKLYRKDHADFQAYCDGKWGFTPQQNSYLIGDAYSERKKGKGAPSGNKNAVNVEEKQMGHNDPFVSTAEEVAAEFNVSVPTVKRNEKYKQALAVIGNVNGKAKADILSGSLKIDKKDVIEIGKLHESEIGACILNVKAGRKFHDDGKEAEAVEEPPEKPVGDRIKTQRQKTVKTVDAAMRAFDDLQGLSSHPRKHKESIAACKILLATAKEWK